MKMHTCPVCGYSALSKPPEDDEICPSCGTQFGYSDSGPEPIAEIHAGLRKYWMDKGAKWQSKRIPEPFLWNPWQQLIDANLIVIPLWSQEAVVLDIKTADWYSPTQSNFGPLRLKVA
jgi:hypothetical protein